MTLCAEAAKPSARPRAKAHPDGNRVGQGVHPDDDIGSRAKFETLSTSLAKPISLGRPGGNRPGTGSP